MIQQNTTMTSIKTNRYHPTTQQGVVLLNCDKDLLPISRDVNFKKSTTRAKRDCACAHMNVVSQLWYFTERFFVRGGMVIPNSCFFIPASYSIHPLVKIAKKASSWSWKLPFACLLAVSTKRIYSITIENPAHTSVWLLLTTWTKTKPSNSTIRPTVFPDFPQRWIWGVCVCVVHNGSRPLKPIAADDECASSGLWE